MESAENQQAVQNSALETVRRTDGQDGPPQAVPDKPSENKNTPGALNSALKEVPRDGDGVDPDHPCAAHVAVVDAERGLVTGVRKKYAVCGFASSTRAAIPIESNEWEILTLNQFYRHCHRSDRHFDIHHNWDSENVPGTDHRGWIRDCGVPVYMLQTHADLPTSVRYPIERVIEKFGDYYTSTVALILALIIDEIDGRVTESLADAPVEFYETPAHVLARRTELYDQFTIGIFGIDLVVGEEYFWQKACAEYFIGIAVGRGIKVMIPPNSALCRQQFRYGWHTEPPTIVKPRELAQHSTKLTEQRDELLKKVYMLEGVQQTLSDLPPTEADRQAACAAVSKEKDELLKRALMLEGALESNRYWNDLVELRLRGADVPL